MKFEVVVKRSGKVIEVAHVSASTGNEAIREVETKYRPIATTLGSNGKEHSFVWRGVTFLARQLSIL